MDDSARKKVLDTLTRQAKDRDARVVWRVNGHAFFIGGSSDAVCVGCDVRVSGWSPSSAHPRVVAEKASKVLPPCTKPWNLEQRLKEIAQRYSRTGQSVGKGGKVTLESVNAKLDRIIQHLRI
jgi:hypothetical protein